MLKLQDTQVRCINCKYVSDHFSQRTGFHQIISVITIQSINATRCEFYIIHAIQRTATSSVSQHIHQKLHEADCHKLATGSLLSELFCTMTQERHVNNNVHVAVCYLRDMLDIDTGQDSAVTHS